MMLQKDRKVLRIYLSSKGQKYHEQKH